MTRILGHWIGGKPVDDDGSRTGEVFDPSTGAVTSRVALADDAMVDRAVSAAKDAWSSWRSVSLTKRTNVLFGFRELVASHLDDLAAMIVAEHGKVHADAAGEVQRGLE